jgi:outer membrane immunogenic protein
VPPLLGGDLMRRLFIGISISLAMVASAAAADFPILTKAAPVVAPIYDWSGFYVGGGLSYSWGRVSDTGTFRPSFISTAAIFDAAPTTYAPNQTLRGLDGEIQGGYRRQFGTMVLGTEVVARLTDEHGRGSCYQTYPTGYPTNTPPSTSPGTAGGAFSCYKDTRLNSTEALLFNVGMLATPQLLLQISGGPAAGQITGCDTASFMYSTGAVTSGSSCHSTDKGGYWAGGGAEYAILSNLHLKLEYYYMDFGTVGTNTQWTDTTGLCTPTTFNSCVHTFANERRVTDNSVLIGINYSFGGGAVVAAPIVTK